MYYRIVFFLALSGTLLFNSGCRSDYEKMVDRELSSGARYDSLFLGIRFGMTRDSFYRHCYDLNHAGLVTNGPENNTVLFAISGYPYPIDMNFYPDFEQDKIYKMSVVFNYQAWAPWNKILFTDKLIVDVLDLMSRWYGPGFLALKKPDGTPFWVNVSGNRQILVMIQNERNVRVEISDLTVKPVAKKPTTARPNEPRPIWEKKKS